METRPAIFKWRQTQPGLILCAVRWLALVKTSCALNSFRISNIQEQELACAGQDVTMLHVRPGIIWPTLGLKQPLHGASTKVVVDSTNIFVYRSEPCDVQPCRNQPLPSSRSSGCCGNMALPPYAKSTRS